MPPGEGDAMRGLSRETKVNVLFTEIQEGRAEVSALKRLLTSMCAAELEMRGVVEALAGKLREAKYSEEVIGGLTASLLPRTMKSRPGGKGPPAAARTKPAPQEKRKRPTAGTIPAFTPPAGPAPAKKGVPVVRAKRVSSAPPAKKGKGPPPKGRPPAPSEAEGGAAGATGKDESSFVVDPAWGFGGDAAAPAAPPAADAPVSRGQERFREPEKKDLRDRPQILIAEDDDRIRMVYRIKMEAAGYEITEAADGAEAWKLLRAQPFDAVVLDMKMPGYHGLDILNRMREAGMEMPVVICTAYDQLADEFVVATYPKLKYLTKPIPPEAIIKGLQDLMKK